MRDDRNMNDQRYDKKITALQKSDKKKDHQNRIKYFNLQVILFVGVLYIFFFIGLLFFFRPSESLLEKRKLTSFPSLKTANFMNGEFTNQISTWYADTFPFREGLIKLNYKVQTLKGIGGMEFISSQVNSQDEIPEEVSKEELEKKLAALNENTEKSKKANSSNHQSNAEKEPQETADLAAQQERLKREQAALEAQNFVGGLFIVDDAAYGFYGFNEENSNGYINMLNNIQHSEPDLNFYNIIAPTSCGIKLSKETQKAVGSSDQKAGFDYINNGIKAINPKVKTVDAYTNIYKHRDEYTHFRTDHHWTQLGAYYAYQAFAETKGVEPVKLEDLHRDQFDGFLGSFYAQSNQNAKLANHPDYVEAYRLKSTNDMTFYDVDSNEYEWRIISDMTQTDDPNKYMTFIAGDQPLVILDNPDINNGDNAILIKDSFGNAFAPLLMANYDKVLVVDYRHFFKLDQYNDNIHQLISDYKVKDVVILMNADSSDNPAVFELIEGMFE